MKIKKIGAHVSVAGSLVNGISNAEMIGANCIQIFASSARQWKIRWPSEDNVNEFKKARKISGIDPVYLHAPYLINLTSADSALRQKSKETLLEYLKVSDFIGANGVIFHIGSGAGLKEEEAFKIAISAIKEILNKFSGQSYLVIENSAGGGAKVGDTLKEVGEIIKAVADERLKFCLDTAHYFEAGQIEKYDSQSTGKLAKDIEQLIGKKRFVAMHVNDSKTIFNSHHDRHENIGEGHIGLAGFKALTKEELFQNIAWILEVPGFEEMGPDQKNIDILKSL